MPATRKRASTSRHRGSQSQGVCWCQIRFTAIPGCIRAAMLLPALSVLLYVDMPKKSGAGTCYIVGQQYSDRFPELVMVELSNGRDSTCFQYRFEILRDLEEGWVYYTAELHESRLRPVNKVEAVEVAGQKYLRIDGRNESRDDLGSVPEI